MNAPFCQGYPYEIFMPDLKPEIYQWCMINLDLLDHSAKPRWKVRYVTIYDAAEDDTNGSEPGWFWSFMNAEDAAWFELTWC